MSEQQKTVIITDVHGYSDKLGAAVNHYGENVRYIMGGDFINKGPDSKGVMDILSGLDTVLLAGNHEWILLASLDEVDGERRHNWSKEVWLDTLRETRAENRFLESYGIGEYGEVPEIQEITREKLQELGHYAMLRGIRLYYEDDEMIVVHAGLQPETSWAVQRGRLDEAARLKEAHHYSYDIPQVFSHKLSRVVERPGGVDKALITGHLRPATDQRIWWVGPEVTRVMLDGNVTKGNPLLVYECWSSDIRAF